MREPSGVSDVRALILFVMLFVAGCQHRRADFITRVKEDCVAADQWACDLLRHRSAPVDLVVDRLPAHKTKLVKDYVQSSKGRLTLHFLPGYAPELNPDEMVWSHVKRTGVARTPLRKGERLRDKIEAQLAKLKTLPRLIRPFFKAPSVAYIADC
jgi:transposase